MGKKKLDIKITNNKPRRFCVGDLHGCYLGLKQALERSGIDYKKDQLITLGDIVDRWPDSYKCVEELLKIENRIDIVGNHDDWFTDFIISGVHPDAWSQGGLSTAQSYADAMGIDLKVHPTLIARLRQMTKYTYSLNLIPEDITESHQRFFKGQHRYYKDDDNNVFVHGGFSRALTLNDTPKDFMIWDRKLWNQALSAKSTNTKLKYEEEINQIFIGHTSTVFWGTDKPMKADKIWNLDTGGGGGGRVTVMDVDTNEYWQSDLVDELYPEND